ncbi:MAG: hypothetical protein PHT96_10280, partial [Syntrophorhabdaceae bacterium]|nr:hypothetical protein [Syntrophorhabdaceae bacterium]
DTGFAAFCRCRIFIFQFALSFPPLESKLLGGKCLTYIGTEGPAGGERGGMKLKAAKPLKKPWRLSERT